MIWERAVIPFLLYLSENWIWMSKEGWKVLSDLQNMFFRAVFSVAPTCPLAIMYFDTKTLSMKLRVMQRKLLFAYHVANLPRNSLAYEVYMEMKNLGLPGLHKETMEFMAELGIGNMSSYAERSWKVEVNKKIEEQNYKDLMTEIKRYKKLSYDELSKEEFEVKSYLKELKLTEARTMMRIRAKMVNTVKFNFQSDPQFTSENWKCSCKGEDSPIESQEHLQLCPIYEDLRCKFDVDSDLGIVQYFDAVLQRRQEKEDENLLIED